MLMSLLAVLTAAVGRYAPTQYEVAMLETLKAVKAGQVPDPALRHGDGQPGRVLDALLPRNPSPLEESQRRKLGRSFTRSFGVNIGFTDNPVLSVINSSVYRYESVEPGTSTDWRNTQYITPIQLQFDCASCWAMAAADTVAMVTAIATGTPPKPASTQQICDCGGYGCCSGGEPENAFAHIMAQGYIAAKASYEYYANDGRTCGVNSGMNITGSITGWERVPAYNQKALIRAVNMHPVLVYISASSPDFQQYWSGPPSNPTSFKIYNGNCSSEISHAMVVVGYNLAGGYWILKNTWPADGWGDNGYMYIAMEDGPGKCGMLTVSPLYPTYFPKAPSQVTVRDSSGYPVMRFKAGNWWDYWNASAYGTNFNACLGIINPCGAGLCISISGIPRCTCPSGFTEVFGVPTSKCAPVSPCTRPLINPCGAGSCLDVGDGSYLCSCFSGFAVGTRTDGAPTCVPGAASLAMTYVAQYGDTCTSVYSSYDTSMLSYTTSTTSASASSTTSTTNTIADGSSTSSLNSMSLDGGGSGSASLDMSLAGGGTGVSYSFSTLNPDIDCSNTFVPGMVTTLGSSLSLPCAQQYSVRANDTCALLANAMAQPSFLQNLSSCANLSCVPPLSTYWRSRALYVDQSTLAYLNPTLGCNSGGSPSLAVGRTVCVAGSVGAPASPVTCTRSYTAKPTDSCDTVRGAFNLTLAQLVALNPGLNCAWNGGTFTPGIQLCVANSQQAQPAIVCSQYYSVKQGDSCPTIWNAANLSQFQFFYINPGLQCQTPYLYTGQQVCIDSPALANISDPSFRTYLVQPNDTWGYVQSQFSKVCKAYSITIQKITDANAIANWTDQPPPVNKTLIIPCVPSVGADCGCAPSLPVCGANFIQYLSFCDAQCNFALPSTSNQCTICQLACAGRMGRTPWPTAACPANYVCPWPTWPPTDPYPQQVFATSPKCNYRSQTCMRACSLYTVWYGAATNATCYNSCMACHRVPCAGPSDTVTIGTSPCTTCASAGCDPYGRSTTTCITDCTFWNTFWSPLNP